MLCTEPFVTASTGNECQGWQSTGKGEKKGKNRGGKKIYIQGTQRILFQKLVPVLTPLGDPQDGSLQSSAGPLGLWGSWARAGMCLGGCPWAGWGGLGAQGRVEAMGRPCCPVHRRLRAVGSRNPLPMRVSPLPPALLHPAGERQQVAAGRGRGEGGLCCTSPTSSCPIPQEMGGRQPGAPPAMGTSPWGGLQGVSAR